METCDEPTFPFFEDALQSSLQAYPASRLPLPGSDEAAKMTVGSGTQCSMWLDQSSPLGAFSRILLESSHWTNSAEYCYVWEHLDTKFALSAFQLTQLGQNTDDNGCLLLPTPNCMDHMEVRSEQALIKAKQKGGCANLKDVMPKLWRSPTGTEGNGGGDNGLRRLEQGHTLRLRDQVKTPKLWPTPTERDRKSTSPGNQDNARPLSEVAGLVSKLLPTARANKWSGLESHGHYVVSGSLNPRFVEELMGFPIDHTALKRSATQLFRSKRIRSSRRSEK